MKVLFLTRYGPRGASSRYRTYQYLPKLREAGIDGDVLPLLDDSYLRRRYKGASGNVFEVAAAYIKRALKVGDAGGYDLVWAEKELFPWLPAPLELASWPRGVPVVLDYDDAMHHRYGRHGQAIVRGMLGGKIPKLIACSAAVVVGNAYLAEYARSNGANRVEVIPTVVDVAGYRKKQSYATESLKMCWIGSPVTSKYLAMIAGPLRRFAEKHSCELVLIGGGDLDLKGVPVKHVDWAPDTEAEAIRNCDVGLMPLPDDPWERGKCGLKLIQYMAAGLPIIASPIGINNDIVEDGVNGFLASGDEQWIACIEELNASESLRSGFGEQGRRKVEKYYDLSVTASVLSRVLLEVAHR
ncbi:glycosyltransferase family 4 protein [bacterium]|nr:glycosyltransferase family 4 protein [bacterium]MBU1676668.1 glycosyltransferase family 4 protein [bacterium]